MMLILVLINAVVLVTCEVTIEPEHHAERVTVPNDNLHHTQLYHQHAEHHQKLNTNSRVLELSDRFLDIVNTPISQPSTTREPYYQPWLIKFYAPWCGHCKRLEPIFNHVAQALHNTAIRVAKIDCTRFPSVGSEFKIHGYPTIMFIQGPTKKHTFQGDRTLDNLIKFAKRMNSPPIQTPNTHLTQFLNNLPRQPERIKRDDKTPSPSPEEKTDLFFMLLKPKTIITDLTTAFKSVATHYQQHAEFFEFTEPEPPVPVVFAYKHGRLIKYTQTQHVNVTSDLESWVGNERFPDFMHVTRGNLYQLFHESQSGYNAKDLIVAAVVEEDKLHRVVSNHENELLGVLRGVAENAVEQSLREVVDVGVGLDVSVTTGSVGHVYSWIGSPDLANSIVAEHLPLPTLLIISRSFADNNHRYYVFSDWAQINTESKIENIIELVKEGHFTPRAYANSWTFKLYRYGFDAKVSLTDMWVGNPVLTIVLFGLPLGFLSLILYSVCCGDILDAQEPEEDELPDDSDSEHEKRE